jgi:hypothetical protein
MKDLILIMKLGRLRTLTVPKNTKKRKKRKKTKGRDDAKVLNSLEIGYLTHKKYSITQLKLTHEWASLSQ